MPCPSQIDYKSKNDRDCVFRGQNGAKEHACRSFLLILPRVCYLSAISDPFCWIQLDIWKRSDRIADCVVQCGYFLTNNEQKLYPWVMDSGCAMYMWGGIDDIERQVNILKYRHFYGWGLFCENYWGNKLKKYSHDIHAWLRLVRPDSVFELI